jgi:hypothetical protein
MSCVVVWSGQAFGQALTVEVVDDSGFTNPPFVLLVGKEVNGAPMSVSSGTGQLAWVDADNAANVISPTRVDYLQANGTLVSPYTGQTRTIRTFSVNTVASGGFYVFYNNGSNTPPFVYINNANPDPTLSNYRFDLCELTYDPSIQSGADLTSIDAFSIPMQLELFNNSTKIGERTYYLSTTSMLQRFSAMGAGSALYEVGAGLTPVAGWTSADGMANFVRALGPGKIASAQGLPTPFPSFSGYLSSLAAANYAFSVNGNANGSYYNYSGTVSTTSSPAGYQMVLTGTTNPPPGPNSQGTGVPANATVTVNLPITELATGTATVSAGQVTSINVTNAGKGYSQSSPPAVAIYGSGGSGASAIAGVNGSGAITQVYMINGGANYLTPTASASQTGSTPPTLTPVVSSGAISSISGSGGSGFSAPTVTISAPGSGTQATAIASAAPSGSINYVYVTSGGSGYSPSSPPAVNISQGSATVTGIGVVDPTSTAVVAVNISNAMPATGTFSSPVVTITETAGGAGAAATATVNADGTISIGAPTHQGSGYTNGATVTIDPPPGSLDFFTYGAVLSGASFSVSGMTSTEVGADTNIVYGAIVRDALAALNFGYMNGQFGSSGSQWYATAPTAFPFGNAAAQNNGFYNPWAALMYNNSDAYGFAFSDRSGPSPLITIPTGGSNVPTLRITILPDSRLDSPKPYVTKATNTSLDIKWQPVPNASQYKITVVSPTGIAPVTQSGTTYSLTTLESGIPYTIKVTALGTGSIESPGQTILASTTGAPGAPSGPNSFQTNFSWIPDFLATGVPEVVNGEITNVYVLNSGYGYASAPTVNILSGGQTTNGNAILAQGIVSFVEITNSGSGYTSTPAVTIAGGTSTASASALVANGSIGTIVLTNPGTGYAVPTVSITGGGGSGATALAHVSASGAVDDILIVNPGSGYSAPPTITITGAGGAGASATGTISSGAVTGYSGLIGGSGYTASPTATIGAPGSGTQATARVWVSPADAIQTVQVPAPGAGYVAPSINFSSGGAVAAAIVNPQGQITGITMVTGGSGYASAPTVNITGGNGMGATATTTISSGVVTGVEVTAQGSGYLPSPVVNVTGGQGFGAQLIPVIVSGTLSNFSIVNAGTGYSSNPSVNASQPIGTGGGATATLSNGSVNGFTNIVAGSGYISPAVSIAAPPAGGTQATAIPVVSNGSITAYFITNPGSGYLPSSPPGVTITPGPAQAQITATNINASGSITGINVTNAGSGYYAPQVVVTSPYPALPTASFDGETVTYVNGGTKVGQWLVNSATPLDLPGSNGTNQYALIVEDGDNHVIFGNILAVEMSSNVPTAATLFGNQIPLSIASGQVNVPFNPEPLKDFHSLVKFPGNSYATWAAGFPGFTQNAPLQNPDFDTHVNLLEYYLYGNPTIVDLTNIPIPGMEQVQEGDDLLMTYQVSKTAVGVSDLVEWSTDLINWETTDVSFEPDIDMGSFIERTARVPLNAGEEKLFMRLRVIQD